MLVAAMLMVATVRVLGADPAANVDEPVTVHARVDRNEITIGDPIRYTVEVSAVAGAEIIVPVLSGTLGEFTIGDFGESPARTDNGRVVLSRWYTLTSFATGDHLIPAPTVQYRPPGEELRAIEGNEVLVGVVSLLAQEKDATDIRDIKPPEALPFDWRPYGIVAAAVTAVALLGVGFFHLLNRPRRQRVVPPRPAHEVALAALNRLRARRLVEAGEWEAYYVELSGIVRQYLEDGFALRAPEMTTEEFLSTAATDGRMIAPHRRLLGDFLTQADQVKFARYLPTLSDSEAAYAAARRFIGETRPVALDAATAGVRHATA